MKMKQRNSNIELLRILSMLMIIAHHYALYGVHQLYDSNKIDSYYAYGTSLNRAISECFLPGGVVGVGIFFLIAGYFGIQSDKIRVSSVIKTVLFYSLFFAFLAAVLHNYGFLDYFFFFQIFQ